MREFRGRIGHPLLSALARNGTYVAHERLVCHNSADSRAAAPARSARSQMTRGLSPCSSSTAANSATRRRVGPEPLYGFATITTQDRFDSPGSVSALTAAIGVGSLTCGSLPYRV